MINILRNKFYNLIFKLCEKLLSGEYNNNKFNNI